MLITLLVTGVFGPNGVKRYEWPLLDLMSTTGFASNYFFQNIVNSTYIFIELIFTLITTAVLLALLSSNFMDLFSLKQKWSKLVLLIIISAIFGVMTIPNVITFKTSVNLLLEAGSIYMQLYIMIIWSVSLFRKQA
jgi:hypothetical protein